jgi:hypothetical protein
MRALRLFALLIALAPPVQAEAPNLSSSPVGEPGAAAQLILAQRAYQAALKRGDPVLLITAIRLGREITLRPPTAWTRTTVGDPAPDQPEGRTAAPDPAGPEAIAIAQGLAGEDPDLQDLVYDLDAQLPHGRLPTAVSAAATLDGGQIDTWQMVLPGETLAEIGLIGDGDTGLGLTVTDAGGNPVCAVPATVAPALCRFTPARNGFFTVEVRNRGALRNSYRLLGN